jgi:transcriptional regulator with XRE-family HTH domain
MMTENETTEKLTPMSLRKRVGLTQRKVAEALDIRVQTVSSWERGGIPNLSPSKMKRLCELFECTIDDLIEAYENRMPSA